MSVQTPPLGSTPPGISLPSPSPSQPQPWPGWLRLAEILGGVMVLLSIGAAFAAPYWPYSQHVLIPAIEEAFKTKVTIQSFHRHYFPHPGCDAEGVSLTLPQNAEGERTVVTVQRITITGRYSDLLFHPRHFAHVRLDRLYVRIPSRSGRNPYGAPEAQGNSDVSRVSIGSVTAHDAVLEFANESRIDPLKFAIHKLRVESIAAGQPMFYQVDMRISEPPGELQSQGGFGPWRSGDVGKIPLHGTVTLKDASLDKYHGIRGTVQSQEHFNGTLDQIYIEGDASVANFELKTAKHPVALFAQFQVVVDGLKGEAQLKAVTAKAGRTIAHAHGSVEKNPASDRRETSVDFSVQHGRAEDILWLFDDDPKPAMLGVCDFAGHIRAPRFGPGFLESLEFNGRFEISDGHFQTGTQSKTNELSSRAGGKKLKDPGAAPDAPVQSLASDVTMQHATATFPNLFFEVPNARARMHGTYNFLRHQVDLHGNLWTQAKLSQDTSGVKAALLKPFDSFFERKHAGARIPVLMDGAISNPHFATEIVGKK